MKKFAVLALLIAVCVTSSNALRCYSCIFPGEEKCQTPKDLQGVECSDVGVAEALGVKNVCLKNVIDVKGIKQITRECSKQGGKFDACSALKDNVEHCSVCDTDLCNGSTNLLIKTWSVMMPIALALFMKLF